HAGGTKCQSTANEGEIKTPLLLLEPEIKGGKVWINYVAKTAVYMVQAKCGTEGIRVKGHEAGLATGDENKTSTSSVQTFEKVVEGVEGQELTLESNTGTGFENPELAWWSQSTTFTTVEPA